MLTQYLIICPLIFIAGFIDAIAGGGGLITLPAYLISGLDSHQAIGTNKVSSSMGSTMATFKYARSGYINYKTAPLCSLFALVGSSLGAKLALLINKEAFAIVMLVMLPITAVFVLRTKTLDKSREPYSFTVTIIISSFIAFIMGLYDGFYGPGTGTFLLILLTALSHLSIKEAQGTCKVINLSANYAALIMYILHGKSQLVLGFVAGLFSMMGNYLGATYFTKKGEKILRPLLVLVLCLLLLKIIYNFINC